VHGIGPAIPAVTGTVGSILSTPLLLAGPGGTAASMAIAGTAAAGGEAARQAIAGMIMGQAIDPATMLREGGVAALGQGVGAGIAAQAQRGAQRAVAPVVPAPAGMPNADRASRNAGLYNPPDKPPRPFEADYPSGARADAAGRLTHDIEGRPLVAGRIVGRRVVGGVDEALPPTEFDAIAAETTGQVAARAPQSTLGRDVGRVSVDRRSRAPTGIALSKALTPKDAQKVYAHELGHVIDQLAGEIPVKGLNAELRQLYSTLNTGQERTRHLTGPQHLGYSGEDIPREWMAEAVRAYMADPNYLKTSHRKRPRRSGPRSIRIPNFRRSSSSTALPQAAWRCRRPTMRRIATDRSGGCTARGPVEPLRILHDVQTVGAQTSHRGVRSVRIGMRSYAKRRGWNASGRGLHANVCKPKRVDLRMT